MHHRWLTVLLALLVTALAVSGCQRVVDELGGGPEGRPPDAPPVGADGGPPGVTVTTDDASMELTASSYCFGATCADGLPPDPPPDVGTADEVVVEFPLVDWQFSATSSSVEDACGDVRVELESLDQPGRWRVPPVGAAGTWDVMLFGQGDGDLATSFRWTTTTDGPLPEPTFSLGVLADNDGVVDSYGTEFLAQNLVVDFDDVTVAITVTGPGGTTEQIDVMPGDLQPCPVPTSVFWSGPQATTSLGGAVSDGPWTYDVELVVDGTSHVATATWPDDQAPDLAPGVPLEFDPPL